MDHRRRHSTIQLVVIMTHSANTKHHIDPPICEKMIQKSRFQRRNHTKCSILFFRNLHFGIILFPHKLVHHFFVETCTFGSFLYP